MGAKEMYMEWQRRLQLISPDLLVDSKPTSDTAFSFLNAAQDRYLKIRHSAGDELTIGSKNFDQNQDSIKSLVVEKTLTLVELTPSGIFKFELPNDTIDEYFLYISSNSNVDAHMYENEASVLANELVDYKDLQKYITTAANAPIIRKPAVALVGDPYTKKEYLAVVVDRFTELNSISLTYYRKPLRFNTIAGTNVIDHCELPESVHSEIVDMAVEMFITEAKYRLATKESNNQ